MSCHLAYFSYPKVDVHDFPSEGRTTTIPMAGMNYCGLSMYSYLKIPGNWSCERHQASPAPLPWNTTTIIDAGLSRSVCIFQSFSLKTQREQLTSRKYSQRASNKSRHVRFCQKISFPSCFWNGSKEGPLLRRGGQNIKEFCRVSILRR